jgi:hypothetical protein
MTSAHRAVEFLVNLLQSYSWGIGASLLVQFVLFLRWLYRRIRNDELLRVFVADIATNHLPHIYDLLQKLCDQQGIQRSQLPNICWVDLNKPIS